MTTVNLTSVNLGGSGSGNVRTFDYGDVDETNFTLIMTVEGAAESGNPGSPTLTGNNIGGRLEYNTGGSSGIRVNRVTINSNRPLASIDWGVFGMSGAPGEYVSFISHNGIQSGMGAGSTGTVGFSDLGGATELFFEYRSESGGNNAAFGPIGSAELTTVNNEDDDTYIRPGTIHIIGTADYPGVYEAIVSVSDSNGAVGSVPVRFEIEAGDGPVVTDIPGQTGTVGDEVSYQVIATSPQNLALTYEAENLPDGLSINGGTGEIGGTLTGYGGIFTVEISVKDLYGNCVPIIFEWFVGGGEPPNLDELTGPVIIGRRPGDPGPWEALNPTPARNILGVYNRDEVDGLIDDYYNLLVANAPGHLDTLEKIADSIGNRGDLLDYVLSLIGDSGGTDLSKILSVLGVGSNATQMPAVGAIDAGSVKDQIEDLEARIPDDTGGLPDQPGQTMLVRSLTTTGPPSAKTRSETRGFLQVYSQSEVNNLLGNKFDDSKGDKLVGLTGLSVNSDDFGNRLNNLVSSGRDLVQVLNEILALIQDLIDNGGGGGGSLTLPANTMAGNFSGSTGPATGKTAGDVRAFTDTRTSSQIITSINLAIAQLDGELTADINALSASLNAQLLQKAAQSVVNALINLSGRSSGSTHHGTFSNNMLAANKNTHQLIEQLGTAVKNLREGNGSWVGSWTTPSLSSSITGQGFTSNGSGTEWGTVQYRVIQLSKHVEFRGAIRRPNGSGLPAGTINLFSVPNQSGQKTRIRPIFMSDDNGNYRDARLIVLASGQVQINSAGWSGAKNINADAKVPL